MSKWDDGQPAIGAVGTLVLVFAVIPACLAAVAIAGWSWLSSAHVPWAVVAQTAIVVGAVWLATGVIVREVRRR